LNRREQIMVTCLLTITIKVNIPNLPNRRVNGVTVMKKTKAGRGFLSWLMGCGWDTAGGNG
jgi:hypothetical protein